MCDVADDTTNINNKMRWDDFNKNLQQIKDEQMNKR